MGVQLGLSPRKNIGGVESRITSRIIGVHVREEVKGGAWNR